MKIFKDTIGIRNRKNRPFGEITSENKCENMIIHAKELAKEISNKDGVIGITLGGGLSRGYGDDFSEIDLNVYLDDNIYQKWIIGMGPIPQYNALWNELFIDIRLLSYEKELSESWNLIHKWDASYNRILFDPEEKIEKLFNIKDMFTSKEKIEYSLKFFEDCEYIGDTVISQWIRRGDPLAANSLISYGVSSLIGMVFLANEEYPPYKKWALNYSYSLQWLPTNWKDRISRVLLTKELTLNEAKKRHRVFVRLYKDCKEKILGREFRNISIVDILTMRELQFIIDNSPVPIERFAENFNITHLSIEPIREFTEIIIKDNKQLIYFKKKKFIRSKQKDFEEIFVTWKLILNKLIMK